MNKESPGKDFILHKEKLHMDYLAYKGNKIEIWHKNDTTKEILDNIPYRTLIHQMFEIYRSEKYLSFRYVLIDDNTRQIDNSLYPKEKMWIITLGAVIDTMRRVLINQGINIAQLDAFLISRGIEYKIA